MIQKTTVILLAFCIVIPLITHTHATPEYMPNQIIVKITPQSNGLHTTSLPSSDQSIPIQDPSFQSIGLKSITKIANSSSDLSTQSLSHKQAIIDKYLGDTYILEYKKDINTMAICADLTNNPNIQWAEPNYIFHTTSTANDPEFSNQSNLPLVGAPTAWDFNHDNTEVVIAIIDSGIDLDHPDLINKLWINPNTTSQSRHGFDFFNNDPDPNDDNGHGTHVAGIAGAQTDNANQVASVCPSCKLMALKASNASGSFPLGAIIQSITFAIQNNAHIINMSLGGSVSNNDSTAFHNAVKAANEAGVLVVVAAGNRQLGAPAPDNIDVVGIVPAKFPEVITVSGSDQSGNYSSLYSNFGDSVDIMAPGLSILSTAVGGGLERRVGTSMSAPTVAGALGLLLGAYPGLSTTNARQLLLNSATDKQTPGVDNLSGHGLLNIPPMLTTSDGSAPTGAHTPPSRPNSTQAITITGNFTDDGPVNTLPVVTLQFRYVIGRTPGNWNTQTMTKSNATYTGVIQPNINATSIDYFFIAKDATHTTLLPSGGENAPFDLVIDDVVEPEISFEAESLDYFSNRPIEVTLQDNVEVATTSITASFQSESGLQNVPQNNLSFTAPTLSIDPSNINISAQGNVILTVTAEDTTGNRATAQLTYQQSNTLALFGPHGPSSKPVTVPNPFDPTREETKFSYQVSTAAHITIQIYSLGLQKVFHLEKEVAAGYHDEDSWNGRDYSGDIVPNGVYIMLLKAQAGGVSKTIRHKIAVLRR